MRVFLSPHWIPRSTCASAETPVTLDSAEIQMNTISNLMWLTPQGVTAPSTHSLGLKSRWLIRSAVVSRECADSVLGQYCIQLHKPPQKTNTKMLSGKNTTFTTLEYFVPSPNWFFQMQWQAYNIHIPVKQINSILIHLQCCKQSDVTYTSSAVFEVVKLSGIHKTEVQYWDLLVPLNQLGFTRTTIYT